MPRFTIESQFLIPVYRHETYDAPTLEAARQMAIDDDNWDASKTDYNSCGPTEVTGAWEGETAYAGPNLLAEAGARFRNTYDCPACASHWEDESETVCDDRCPDCNLSCSPSGSEDIEMK